MTKRILLTLVQFLLFCGLFYLGGYWSEIRFGLEVRAMQNHTTPPPMLPVWQMHVKPTLDYILNGPIFAGTLAVLILLGEAIRRRLRPWAGLTALAYLLAFLLSLAVKSGFVQRTPGLDS